MKTKKRSADQTREAILCSTRKVFAEKGYERATIRAIAADAGCDPALVMRYFGCKHELFQVAVSSPFETFPDAQPGEPGDLASVAEALLEAWRQDPTFFGMLRAAASNEEAADSMRRFFDARVREHQPRVTGLPPDEAVCFGAMIVGVAWAREITKIAPLSEMSSAEIGKLVRKVLESTPASSS